MSSLKTASIFLSLLCLTGLSARVATAAGDTGVSVSSLAPHANRSLSTPRRAATDPDRLQTGQLYDVSDEKGVLLSCIAPEIETNADTDRFENCHLAPGRTLDELMHAIVGGIHYEQTQHEQERTAWIKQLDEMMDQKDGVASRK